MATVAQGTTVQHRHVLHGVLSAQETNAEIPIVREEHALVAPVALGHFCDRIPSRVKEHQWASHDCPALPREGGLKVGDFLTKRGKLRKDPTSLLPKMCCSLYVSRILERFTPSRQDHEKAFPLARSLGNLPDCGILQFVHC